MCTTRWSNVICNSTGKQHLNLGHCLWIMRGQSCQTFWATEVARRAASRFSVGECTRPSRRQPVRRGRLHSPVASRALFSFSVHLLYYWWKLWKLLYSFSWKLWKFSIDLRIKMAAVETLPVTWPVYHVSGRLETSLNPPPLRCGKRSLRAVTRTFLVIEGWLVDGFQWNFVSSFYRRNVASGAKWIAIFR